MKRMLVLALITVIGAALPGEAAARHTLAHRVTALEKKVNALHTFAHNCLAADWVPIGWYGNEGAGVGYMYDNDGANPTQAPFYTTALDVAAAPAETAFVVASVKMSCVGQIAARRSFAAQVEGLQRSLRALR